MAGLTVRYGTRTALNGLDLQVETGTTLAVIGPNGSGKSTLLQALAGLIAPTEGTVAAGPGGVALVLQSTDVDRSLPITVRETVRMARYRHRGLLGRFRPEDRNAISDAMERLDIEDLARRQLHELSGGQRQRAMVAQGLAQQADLLLLDEPVTGLDLVSRQTILDVIDDERNDGRTVIVTTHDLDDARRCDRVLLLAGRAIALGPPEAVIQEENLREAFGGTVLRLPSGDLLMDDPHHTHSDPHHRH